MEGNGSLTLEWGISAFPLPDALSLNQMHLSNHQRAPMRAKVLEKQSLRHLKRELGSGRVWVHRFLENEAAAWPNRKCTMHVAGSCSSLGESSTNIPIYNEQHLFLLGNQSSLCPENPPAAAEFTKGRLRWSLLFSVAPGPTLLASVVNRKGSIRR